MWKRNHERKFVTRRTKSSHEVCQGSFKNSKLYSKIAEKILLITLRRRNYVNRKVIFEKIDELATTLNKNLWIGVIGAFSLFILIKQAQGCTFDISSDCAMTIEAYFGLLAVHKFVFGNLEKYRKKNRNKAD